MQISDPETETEKEISESLLPTFDLLFCSFICLAENDICDGRIGLGRVLSPKLDDCSSDILIHELDLDGTVVTGFPDERTDQTFVGEVGDVRHRTTQQVQKESWKKKVNF